MQSGKGDRNVNKRFTITPKLLFIFFRIKLQINRRTNQCKNEINKKQKEGDALF